jgi:hypothetical protein
MRISPSASILTGTVVARKALRLDAHRFAASGFDPAAIPVLWLPCLQCRSLPPNPAPLLPFPRTRSGAMPDVKNDHFLAHNFIHDQIFADRKT